MICCTLREDLLLEIAKLGREGRFDYLLGHMLMTFEGFTLHARIKDTIEVVGEPE